MTYHSLIYQRSCITFKNSRACTKKNRITERDQVARLRSTLLSSGVYELLQIFAESSRTIYLSDL